MIHLYQHPPTATQINIIVPVVPQMWLHHMFLFSPFHLSLSLFLLLLFSVYLGALRKCTACDTCQVVSISQKAWAQLGWHGQCHGRSTSLCRWMGGDLCKKQRYHANMKSLEVFLSSPLIEWTRWRETLVPSSLLAFFVIIDVVLEEMIFRQFDRLIRLT